jgi:hypothetical protein
MKSGTKSGLWLSYWTRLSPPRIVAGLHEINWGLAGSRPSHGELLEFWILKLGFLKTAPRSRLIAVNRASNPPPPLRGAAWSFEVFLSQTRLQAYDLVMSVEEIESVISGLSAAELARFSQWFEEFLAGQWDRQIEQDMLAGRLDAAIKRADDHYKAGRCTSL